MGIAWRKRQPQPRHDALGNECALREGFALSVRFPPFGPSLNVISASDALRLRDKAAKPETRIGHKQPGRVLRTVGLGITRYMFVMLKAFGASCLAAAALLAGGVATGDHAAPAPLKAGIEIADPLTVFPAGEAGNVEITVDGPVLTVHQVNVEPGWEVAGIERDGDDAVVTFRRGGELLRFRAHQDGGELTGTVDQAG